MAALCLPIPITKVDIAQRLVYGLATAEIEDRAGEICDYATTKPLYEKWSQDIKKSSSGKSLGNLRAMHGTVAAGKVTALTFNDQAKQIEICAKVIDDVEWKKVEEGVYTGFSQGGTYAKRWTDASGARRYTADPNEISLVDMPCLPEARFEMIKADGSFEFRPFRASSSFDLDKVGARNNAVDQDRIQYVHDTAVDLGATCNAMKYHAPDLTKQFDALADRLMSALSDITHRLKAIEDEPRAMPLAMQAHAVTKYEDAGLASDQRLEALLADPKALSLLAIKLAQRQNEPQRR